MAYRLEISAEAQKDLRRLDRQVAERVARKLLQIVETPHAFLERAVASKSWKLRVGDYRAIIDIHEAKKTIVVLHIDHRKRVYKRFEV
jgi:mRNA interferase RelE/StbE